MDKPISALVASLSVMIACASRTAVEAAVETHFAEAEQFTVASDGWRVIADRSVREASDTRCLNGSTGDVRSTASTKLTIEEAGNFRVWVRHTSSPRARVPFRVAVLQDGREIAGAEFDEAAVAKPRREAFVWSSFDARFPAGELRLQLSKADQKNCSGAARTIDCLLVTSDLKLSPDHLDYGPQTYLRVTFGPEYTRPVYLHVFADHHHAPWYQHWSLAGRGAVQAVSPSRPDLLKGGQSSPWCNISRMLYADGGALLNLSVRHGYTEPASELKAVIEFATAPDERAVVRTIAADCRPNGMVIAMPPHLGSAENLALLKTDREIAESTGQSADAFDWPTYGRKPDKFPFFVSARFGTAQRPCDAAVAAREQKTLDYFGFLPREGREIGGVWHMLEQSYCRPDLEKMQSRAALQAAEFRQAGHSVDDILFCELTDEPTGQPLAFMAQDAAYQDQFRSWLKNSGLTPAELLVGSWDDVKIVTRDQSEQSPALYYFSQRFRTRALGDFMATQRKVLESAYGRTLPVLANFSDGAVYSANFYGQGVDYFELLSAPDQNAIWGEDWANHSSTYQCASFNVDLMRAAARDRGQTIGHHLIAYAGRTPWDVKLKATSELARGVKMLNSFSYGPSWAGHEGGPYWRSHAWYAKPEMWRAHAELLREIGTVEDLLMEASPAPAKVALLYSSSSDIWTIEKNLATGFDRMHTWLALAHAQIPVDIVSEDQAARGALDKYEVCYLSGPNLSRSAAAQLKSWVESGGTLWLTAGAAARDEYNRPLPTLASLLPATRGEPQVHQAHLAAGKFLTALTPRGTVRWEGGDADVLSLSQAIAPHPHAVVLARFDDQSPAIVTGAAARGRIYCVGFLPGLAYIRPALSARKAAEEAGSPQAGDTSAEFLSRSANPWQFPAAIRELILRPVRDRDVRTPLVCDTPLVDAVYMTSANGVLIPIANYTLSPLRKVRLEVACDKAPQRVQSARHGALPFRHDAATGRITFELPVDANDYVRLD